jgi:hypothetical protein
MSGSTSTTYLGGVGSSHKRAPEPHGQASLLTSEAHRIRTRSTPSRYYRTLCPSTYPFHQSIYLHDRPRGEAGSGLGRGQRVFLSHVWQSSRNYTKTTFNLQRSAARRKETVQGSIFGFGWVFLLLFLMTLSIISLCNHQTRRATIGRPDGAQSCLV